MHGRDLKQREVIGIGNPAREMNPFRQWSDFSQHDLPPAAPFLWTPSVADLVSSDDHDMSLGSGLQDSRKRTHEAVKPTIGLQIARHIGQNLILAGQFPAVWQSETGVRIRPDKIDIDPVMDDADLVTVDTRKLRLLPFGRTIGQIRRLDRQKMLSRASAGAKNRIGAGRELRIEPDIGAPTVVVELRQ